MTAAEAAAQEDVENITNEVGRGPDGHAYNAVASGNAGGGGGDAGRPPTLV